MQHFTPIQLNEKIASSDSLFLLDVRESWEFDTCHLEGSILIPMDDIPNKLDQLDKNQTIAVICHHGRRSLNVANFLENNGFEHLINLTGGIDAWAEEVDRNMAKY